MAYYNRKICRTCPYYGPTRPASDNVPKNPPLSKEDNGSSVLLIFQSPGSQEWVNCRPIVNPRGAGKRLGNSWMRINKTRYDFDITNAVQCYPGRDGYRDRRPPAAAWRACQNWLRKDVEIKRYGRIIVFGGVARKSIIGLGFETNPRVVFLRHPTGALTNRVLDSVLKASFALKKVNFGSKGCK